MPDRCTGAQRLFGRNSMDTSTTSSIIPYLFMLTFLIALVIGVWQYKRARKARLEHHRSASAEANHEPVAGDRTRTNGRR